MSTTGMQIPMKVGYITRLLSKQGAPRTALLTCRTLIENGVDAIPIFVKDAEGYETYKDLLVDSGYLVLYRSNHKGPFTFFFDKISGIYMYDRKGILRIDLDLLRKASYRLKDLQLDYVICQNRWTGITGYRLWKMYGIPYSVLIQENLSSYKNVVMPERNSKRKSSFFNFAKVLTTLFGTFINRMEYKVLNNSIKIFATSETIRKSIVNKYPSLTSKISLNYRGLNLYDFERNLSYNDRQNRIIVDSQWDVGRVPESYLEIAKNLPNYSILMTGGWRDINLKEQIIKMAVSEKISNFKILSTYSQSELIEIFKTSKFACRLGYNEGGIPNAFLLSVSTETPIIVNEGIGCAEIIKEKGGGVILTEPSRISELVSTLERVDQYEKLQKELKQLRTEYTWSKHVSNLIAPFDNSN